MSKPAIIVEGISKKYQLGLNKGPQQTFREAATSALTAPLRRLRALTGGQVAPQETGEFWALKDVNFEVQPGEVVGIIGRNGAGKSTLLKILSRITEPTAGRIRLRGRVASLLEVGTGFHPELTGRENIYLNGAILGMKREEIKRKFDEIVAFAEVEKFLDTPVKRYSTGMYVRLAFAVAAHLEPEILIVDEVLAVGDAEFQKKCLGKMQDVARGEGRTVLFVSHNITALKSLCNRAIWLNSGQLLQNGLLGDIISNYLTSSDSILTEQIWNDLDTAPGNDSIRLQRVAITPETGSLSDQITVATPLKLEFEYWNFDPDACLNLSVHLFNMEDICIFATVSTPGKMAIGSVKSRCFIPANLLNDGTYRIKILVVRDASKIIFNDENILIFEVSDIKRQINWYGKWPGAVRPNLKWQTKSEECEKIN